jgi:hypothetical protein
MTKPINDYSETTIKATIWLNDKVKYFNNRITEEYVKIYLLYIYIIVVVASFFIYFLPFIVASFFIILTASVILFSTYENSQLHYEAVSILLNKEYEDTLIEIDSKLAKEHLIEPGFYYKRDLEKNEIFIYGTKEERLEENTIKEAEIDVNEIDIDKKIKILELELELAKLKNK